MGLIPPNDMNSIIKKDALYNAIGLAAFELFDEVDFDRWFSQVYVSWMIYFTIFTTLLWFLLGFVTRTASKREQLSHITPAGSLVARPMDRS